MAEPIDIPRLIHTICYYYPGITKPILANTLWFLDKMFSEEPLNDWIITDGQADHPALDYYINLMIAEKSIKVVDNFVRFYNRSGFVVRESSKLYEPYKVSDGWTERVRMVLKYLIFNAQKFEEIVQQYADDPIPAEQFIEDTKEEIMNLIHLSKVA